MARRSHGRTCGLFVGSGAVESGCKAVLAIGSSSPACAGPPPAPSPPNLSSLRQRLTRELATWILLHESPPNCRARRFLAFAAFIRADIRRAADLTRTARWSGGSSPSGSTSRSSRAMIADRAAAAWSSRAMYFDQRVFAATCARSRRCSGVVLAVADRAPRPRLVIVSMRNRSVRRGRGSDVQASCPLV